MRCLRLTHVNLRVDRLVDAVRFYAEVLGLERIQRDDGAVEGKGAWFRVSEAEVHLTEDPTPQPLSRRHVALEVDDLEEARRRIEGVGAPIEQKDPGRFWTRDPGGNRIEIVQCASER